MSVTLLPAVGRSSKEQIRTTGKLPTNCISPYTFDNFLEAFAFSFIAQSLLTPE